MENSTNHAGREALALEIQKNYIEMKIAGLKAEGLSGAIQSAKQNLNHVRSRHFARKKKSG